MYSASFIIVKPLLILPLLLPHIAKLQNKTFQVVILQL